MTGPDPVRLSARAWGLEQAAAGVARAAAGFADAAESVAADALWTGEAAGAYQTHVRWLTADLERIAPRLREMARALDEYAAALRAADASGNDAALAAPVARATAAVADAAARLPRFDTMGPREAGLTWPEAVAGLREGADMAAASGANFFRNFMKEVAGYVRADGAQVTDYVRWRQGLAPAMNAVAKARDLEYLKYADRTDWALAGVAGAVAGYEQYEEDQSSGRHYAAPQEAARVTASGGLTLAEVAGAGVTGMAIGAAVGSVIPGAGTVVGAGIGFAVGVGITVGASVLIDHFHVNDAIKQRAFRLLPGVFGG